MDTFNVISGLVTIASFVFSLVLFVQDRALRRSLEAGLTGLIGSLDTLAHVAKEASEEGNSSTPETRALAAKALGYSVASRNHAIALLKSFTDRESRFSTFDFGIPGATIAERLRLRRERNDCATAGQLVAIAEGTRPVQELVPGDSVLSYDLREARFVPDTVTSVREAQTDRFVRVNRRLEVTESHEFWCQDRGWVSAGTLCVGDVLMTSGGRIDEVVELELVSQQAKVYAVSVMTHRCYFVGGYLAHNK